MVQGRIKGRALNIKSDEISDSIVRESVSLKLLRADFINPVITIHRFMILY
jgi:hypothetical protein